LAVVAVAAVRTKNSRPRMVFSFTHGAAIPKAQVTRGASLCL